MIKILVVKTSSLGDIIQSFPILGEIRNRIPSCQIDWVVEKSYEKLLKSHPLVDSVISFERRKLISFVKNLRKKKYDVLFDLQGNTKSALVTLFSSAKEKVGYGKKSVREITNLLVTNHKYNISKKISIQDYYLSLVKMHLNIKDSSKRKHVNLRIDSNQGEKVYQLENANTTYYKIMVALGSAWKNKELDLCTLLEFLQKVKQHLKSYVYFVYGTDQEKKTCNDLLIKLGENCSILPKMEIPLWQNTMAKMDLVITVDTAALHLAATTNTITFSIFGPTSSKVFKPQGLHFSIQGTCPYSVKFEKQCPYLRKCSTGACIKKISVERLWEGFQPCLMALKTKKPNI